MKHVVVDTSYLAHLLQIAALSSPEQAGAVKSKFEEENGQGSVFYVPVPVLFELCNHIAQVGDGQRRRELAIFLRDSVRSSLSNQNPWTITPESGEILSRWVASIETAITTFANEFALQEIGLTDIAIIQESARIQSIVRARRSTAPVHIWTTDHALKAREPSPEANPYLG